MGRFRVGALWALCLIVVGLIVACDDKPPLPLSTMEPATPAASFNPESTRAFVPTPASDATPMASATPDPTSVPTPKPTPRRTPTPTPVPLPTATTTSVPDSAPTPVATLNPTPLLDAAPTPREKAIARLIEALWWAESSSRGLESNLQGYEAAALEQLIELWIADEELGEQVSSFPWLLDGVNELEQEVLSSLVFAASANVEIAREIAALPWHSRRVVDSTDQAVYLLSNIANIDRELGTQVMSIPWVSGFLTNQERRILQDIVSMAMKDVEFARDLVSLPWFNERPNFHTEQAPNALGKFVVKDDLELGRLALSLPWVRDDITRDEVEVLTVLSEVKESSRELAKNVAAFPWFVDGVTRVEMNTLRYFEAIADEDVRLAAVLAGFPWIADELSETEIGLLRMISTIDFNGEEFSEELAAIHWLNIVPTEAEANALVTLFRIAGMDAGLARKVVSLPWFADGVTHRENAAILALEETAFRDTEIAKSLIDMPRIKAGVENDLSYFLMYASKDLNDVILQSMAGSSWFVDGLEDEEVVMIVTLSHQSFEFQEALINDGSVRRETISLPLTGEVTVWLVQNGPHQLQQKVPSALGTALRTVEGFMGSPLPTTDVILMSASKDGPDYRVRQGHYGSHMVVGDIDGEELPDYQYVAGYYFAENFRDHLWLMKGGDEYIDTLFSHGQGYQDLSVSREELLGLIQRACTEEGVENIRQSEHLTERGLNSPYQCTGIMGENLLHQLKDILGEEGMTLAMNKIYIANGGYFPGVETGDSISEREIYKTFLQNAGEERREDVRELYQRLHGGTFVIPPGEVGDKDGHGDSLGDATEIGTRSPVTGAINSESDYDYFRIDGKAGELLSIWYYDDFMGNLCHRLFRADGSEVLDWPAGCDGSAKEFSGGRYGFQMTLPDTDVYYLALYGNEGSTLGYRFEIEVLD